MSLLPRQFLREQWVSHSSVSNAPACSKPCVFTPGSAEQFSSSRFISAFWRHYSCQQRWKKKVKAFGALSTWIRRVVGDVPDMRLHLTDTPDIIQMFLRRLCSLYQKVKSIYLSEFTVIIQLQFKYTLYSFMICYYFMCIGAWFACMSV